MLVNIAKRRYFSIFQNTPFASIGFSFAPSNAIENITIKTLSIKISPKITI